MARPRTVSQWGPNAQGVRSRPSRAVSLRDVRELPVQRMGFDFNEFDRLISEGTSEAERHPWDLVEDPETGELVERGSIKRGLASHPGFNLPEVVATAIGGMAEEWRLWDEADWEAVHAEVMGKILEGGTPMEDPSDLVWDEIEAQLTPPDVEEREWVEDRSVGLSEGARRLVEQPGGFTPSPPVSGLLPGAPLRGPQLPTVLSMEGQQRLPGMEPPPPDWRLTPEQIATGKEWLPKVRDTLEGTRPPADDLDPQSQMSQTMLADLFARRAAEQQNQSQQGYFGGLGRAVGGMSTEQKIALALALTLLTGGGASPAVGSALGVGAGLAAAG